MLDLGYWRSILFVPATQDRYIESALRQPADALQIDLEDSVAPDEKAAARERVRALAARFAAAGYGVAVRINRPWRLAVRDIEHSVCADVAVLTLPKVPDAAYIRAVAEILHDCEAEQGLPSGHTRLIAMIEDPAGLHDMAQIAAASPRMLGLTIGAEDLAATMHMSVSDDALYVPSVMAVAACRRAGILPIGFVGSVGDFQDEEAFRSKMQRARGLGFAAAFCIHPKQVEIINRALLPDTREVDEAHQLIAEYDAQAAQGRATFAFKGRMVDWPVVLQARQLIERHRTYSSGA